MSIIDCKQTELYPLSALLHDRVSGDLVRVEDLPSAGNTQGQAVWAFSSTFSDGRKQIAWMSPTVDPEDISVQPFGRDLVVSRWTGQGYEGRGSVKPMTVSDLGGFKVGLGVDAYWGQFGIEHVELPDNCPILTALWDRICQRFNESWYDRFLAGETMEQWQRRLQVITDRITPRYERALRLYAENKGLLDSAVRMGSTTVYDTTDTSRSRTADTPDTAINNDPEYAGEVTDDESTRTGTVTVNADLLGGAVASLNANIDEWRDLETELIDEYRAGFLALVWF